MSHPISVSSRITIPFLQQKKQKAEKITMLTAYDFPSAYLLDQSEIDIVLVGDSLAMTVLGQENTLSVTMDEMIYHTKAVARACKRALVVGDMPFGSYQSGINQAVQNGLRFIKEGGCAAIKLEGGKQRASIIASMVEAEIPVMAHIGLTPQSMHRFGGFRVQGKSHETAMSILDDAFAVQEAGAFAVVLESIPIALAAEITPRLRIPAIGIGAGIHCDGQVLVWHDFLGLHQNRIPRFVKQYANLYPQMLQAVNEYCSEVRQGIFPDEQHGYCMPDQERFAEKVAEKYGNCSANPSNEGKLEESKI
jgi:3-methyl-2-oxobutanoate hydroxymethyltransferase